MTLEELLRGFEVSLSPKTRLHSVGNITCHSKQVKPGDLFVAIKGPEADGAVYIPEALKRGATVIVSEQDFPSDPAIVKLIVKDSRKALAHLAFRFYDAPSEKLRVIGITGTNGKTTVSYFIESILKEGGYGVGVIGTIAYRIGERMIPASNTTPGVLEVHSLLSQMAKEKADYAVIEVSSHALDQRRVENIRFSVAVFTNLAQDHLDYHKTQEAYFQAKRRLFESLRGEAVAVLNADSPYTRKILSVCSSQHLTYGLRGKSDITARSLKTTQEGIFFEAVTPQGKIPITSSLIGQYNVYNILSAIGVGVSQGIPLEVLQRGIARLKGVPGRLEKVDAGQSFKVFVDFAHTEEALREVLLSLREITPGRLLLVFGCGGDRDRSKRPRMAKVAGRLADEIIVTSDNPRHEDPRAILKEIEAGFPLFTKYRVEEDRARAIQMTLLSAREGDTVLIAGKGHEAYQIFKDRVVPFDDRQATYEILSYARYSQGYGRALTPGRG